MQLLCLSHVFKQGARSKYVTSKSTVTLALNFVNTEINNIYI